MKGRRYKKEKNLKDFLIFYIIISLFFIAIYTFSRYVTTVSGNSQISIAKFNVTVNGKSIVEDKAFDLTLSPTTTTTDNKIAPNSTGYFEIEINPNLTEVSLEYEFIFNLKELDDDFKLTYFTVNEDNMHHDITENTTVKGDIPLPSTGEAFTNEDKVNIKVYWAWDGQDDIYNENINALDKKNISVSAIVRQKIK